MNIVVGCITIIRFSIQLSRYVLNPVKEDLLEPDKLIIIPSVIRSRPVSDTSRQRGVPIG